MFLRAGLLALGLLLASRLLGLLRESALAASFGASGRGDIAVLMLTLPDWIAGVAASGALAYVLLPAWARQSPEVIAAGQRKLALTMLGGGIALALLVMLARYPALDLLAAGLRNDFRPVAAQAFVLAAAAVPLALLAALWTTRLQHQHDFVGMYSANLVVNVVLIAFLLFAASLNVLGLGLVLAMVLRLAWLWYRLPTPPAQLPARAPEDKVAPRLWLFAVLLAGLPLALPFTARSLASPSGEGALAVFNYAWKLVELPLTLAIQLVATIAFPGIARAFAGPMPKEEGLRALRSGLAVAWTLACAAAAALFVGAPGLAQLLFGWGKMDPQSLAFVAEWGRTAAWGLLPQAYIAVGLTALASQRRMAPTVIAYGLALAALIGLGVAGLSDGETLMVVLNMLLTLVALVVMVSLGGIAPLAFPGTTFLVAAGAMLFARIGAAAGWFDFWWPLQVVAAFVAACAVVGVTLLASRELRGGLRR